MSPIIPLTYLCLLQTHSLSSNLLVNYFEMFLSAVYTLVLTAPILRRGFIGDRGQMLYSPKSVPMKKQTHPNLGWRECE